MEQNKQKNFIVTYNDGTPEKKLFDYRIAYSLAEMTGGHVLIIIN